MFLEVKWEFTPKQDNGLWKGCLPPLDLISGYARVSGDSHVDRCPAGAQTGVLQTFRTMASSGLGYSLHPPAERQGIDFKINWPGYVFFPLSLSLRFYLFLE